MDTQTLVIVLIAVVILVAVAVVLVVSRRRAPTDTAVAPPSGRLARTAAALGAALHHAWDSGIEARTWEELEEALIASDVGVESAGDIVAAVRASRPDSADEARQILSDQLKTVLTRDDRDLTLDGDPSVVLMVGVNGTGKTTSIARLGSRLMNEGNSVLFAAADTFRAGAGAQLRTWGDRLGAEVVGGQEGGDPASVAYDAIGSARAKGVDVVIVDTAGRLHGKKNLMSELSKIHRVSAGERGQVDEVLLVLDATGGQNGIVQVEEFSNAVPVSGIVLTKLDGTAKGGIVIAVERQLGVPVKLVGLGEGIDDMEPFDPDRFVTELLEQS